MTQQKLISTEFIPDVENYKIEQDEGSVLLEFTLVNFPKL